MWGSPHRHWESSTGCVEHAGEQCSNVNYYQQERISFFSFAFFQQSYRVFVRLNFVLQKKQGSHMYAWSCISSSPSHLIPHRLQAEHAAQYMYSVSDSRSQHSLYARPIISCTSFFHIPFCPAAFRTSTQNTSSRDLHRDAAHDSSCAHCLALKLIHVWSGQRRLLCQTPTSQRTSRMGRTRGTSCITSVRPDSPQSLVWPDSLAAGQPQRAATPGYCHGLSRRTLCQRGV